MREYFHAWKHEATWKGEYYVWWNVDDSSVLVDRNQCNRIAQTQHYLICQIAGPGTEGMPELVSNLVENGVEDLPDPKDLKVRPILYADGTSLVVAIKRGTAIRRYQYANPSGQKFPEAKRAASIIETMLRFRKRHFKLSFKP